eukprot:30786_1
MGTSTQKNLNTATCLEVEAWRCLRRMERRRGRNQEDSRDKSQGGDRIVQSGDICDGR